MTKKGLRPQVSPDTCLLLSSRWKNSLTKKGLRQARVCVVSGGGFMPPFLFGGKGEENG